jgi:hypothetical protein
MVTTQFFDVLVPKEYESRQNGQAQKRTAWNRVGRAWTSKSSETLSFELFLIPNQRYVIQLKEREKPKEQELSFEDAPF